MTAQTIAPLPTATSAGIVIVPDFVDGGGWRTQVILINPSDTASTGTVEFFNEGSATADATALTISVNGATASVFNYAIAAGAAASFVTSGQGTNVLTGSVRVTPTGGTIPPAVFAVISFVNGGVTQFQTTVQTLPPANALRSYVEMRDAIQNATTQTDRIQSAVAIANNSAATATVNFELTTMDGTMLVPTASVNIPAFGHTSRFIRDLFPTIDLPFQGVLRISSFSSVVVAAFRTRNNKLGTFLMAATPVTNEASPTSTADLFFPNIANGGGYATQFILFSGITQQNTTGALRFVRPDGQDLNLPIR
jgi:hypothetical protein